MENLIKRIGERERQYVQEVLDTDFRSSDGSTMMTRLERAFADKFGVKYAVSMINGTETLHTAVAAAGAGPGDEVVVPPLTMASTAFGVLQNNAIPVFADVDEDTFNLSPAAVENAISERTKAIMPVSLYGLPCDAKAINEIKGDYSFKLLVGGAPITEAFAEEVGADGYALDAGLAAAKAKELCK